MTISQQIQNLEKNLTKSFDGKFEQVEKNLLNHLDDKFQKSEKRLEKNLSNTFDSKFIESEKRLEKSLEKKFNQASKDLNQQLKFQTQLILDSVEEKFEDRQKELRNDILGFKNDVFTELKSNRQETIVNSGRITRLEKSFLLT